MEKQTLYQKLVTIQKSLTFLKKEKAWYNFKYAEGSVLLAEVRGKMDELWLILKQEIIDAKNTVVSYNTYDAKTQRTKEKTEVLVEAVFRFTWIDSETWDTDVSEFRANWFNDFDKWMGSAATYAERYFILKFFHIPTDEDDNDKRKKVWEVEKSKKKLEERKNAIDVYSRILWDSWKRLSWEQKNARVSARLGRNIERDKYTEEEAEKDLFILLSNK